MYENYICELCDLFRKIDCDILVHAYEEKNIFSILEVGNNK